ncbi:MAG: hypothetical protein V2A34_14715, partial [Lentisphaerota bacterium]
MDDLLRQYRRAARLKDVDECLRCLRLIVARPPGGSDWREDLEALEAQWMDHAQEQFPVWIKNGDTSFLERVLQELTSFSSTTKRNQF